MCVLATCQFIRISLWRKQAIVCLWPCVVDKSREGEAERDGRQREVRERKRRKSREKSRAGRERVENRVRIDDKDMEGTRKTMRVRAYMVEYHNDFVIVLL